jgi:hypothetical protein
VCAANPGVRRGHRPGSFGHFVLEPDGALAIDINHEQARGQGSRRAAAQKCRSGKVKRARGKNLIDGIGHGAHSATGHTEGQGESPCPGRA